MMKGADAMSQLLNLFLEQKNIQNIIGSVGKNTIQAISGLADSARAALIAAIAYKQNKQTVVFTANLHEANELYNDLRVYYKEENIFVYNVNDMLMTQLSIASPEEQAERIETLEFLMSEEPGIILLPIAGARKLLPPKQMYADSHIAIDLDSEIEIEELAGKLVSLGYVREQLVAKPGEFSIRGGIIDIYPFTEKYPVRIELFDIEVDSIRSFDAGTQRSLSQLEKTYIPPVTEAVLPKQEWDAATARVKKAYEETLATIEDTEKLSQFSKNLAPTISALENKEWHEDFAFYTSFLYEDLTTILDYIADDAVFIFDEFSRLLESNQVLEDEAMAWFETQANQQRLLVDQKISVDFNETYLEIDSEPQVFISLMQEALGGKTPTATYEFHYREMQKFFGQMEMITEEVKGWLAQGYALVVMTENDERAKQVQEGFQEFQLPSVILNSQEEIVKGTLQILPYTVQHGFQLMEEKIAILTESELFNRTNKKRRRQLNITNAERIKDYNELNPGDYVVHINHGIGKYLGLETVEVRGVHQDYLSVEYQKGARVLIPVTQLDLIQKYVSAEGKAPRIHKLGGTTWARTKSRVQKQVEDIADDLIELYAERESRIGHAFGKDDAYYHEFEHAFPYVETDDQLKSIREVSKDMENEKPMDRLIVGDVGFGKTEVAMRAAFKAVQDGKQVAFLVPTTVLAQQHYESFLDRFADFPVEIEMISRFRTKKQSDEILDQARKGQIDILIGTHRVLSKDVKFQDLGLLVVDEEQRFGVKHKERIKQMKKNVDVLTLTATPIPRTLHMSLVGARDLSVIETPPANRYPVQTYVLEMSPLAIREAISREMARSGQVFFLHNRVETIEQRVKDIEELVPQARVAYIHGRMTETQLENILYEFLEGEYDVLVTTTIIETGIDMPNVNTILVENADHMGLSQLYQLRGRVGRSNRLAYAYFMFEPNKLLTEESEKRLQAIKDFTELGSGFKIAMRDLSIRGAGNLLGQQQSGFIDSVGFDLYSQMLQDAVAAKQGDGSQAKVIVEIDLDVDAYIPSEYVDDERQKIELYKRIRSLASEDEYVELQDEFIDRFGDFPQAVEDLLTIGLIKFYSEKSLIEQIKQKRSQVYLTFSKMGTEEFSVQDIFKALEDVPLKVDVEPGAQFTLEMHLRPGMETYEWLQYILKFVRNLQKNK